MRWRGRPALRSRSGQRQSLLSVKPAAYAPEGRAAVLPGEQQTAPVAAAAAVSTYPAQVVRVPLASRLPHAARELPLPLAVTLPLPAVEVAVAVAAPAMLVMLVVAEEKVT